MEDRRQGVTLDASPAAVTLAMLMRTAELEQLEKWAGEREIAGADDQVEQMSQALNRLRAMVSLPKYSSPNAAPPGGRPRMNGVICGSGTAPSGASFR